MLRAKVTFLRVESIYRRQKLGAGMAEVFIRAVNGYAANMACKREGKKQENCERKGVHVRKKKIVRLKLDKEVLKAFRN